MLPIIKKYYTAIHAGDGKVVASNFAYLSILQVVGYVFPLITIPYLASVIGVDGFGKIAFAASIMVWVQTVVDWGFNYTATRDVAKNRDNPDMVSAIFSNVLWAKIFLMLVSFIILVFLILLIPKFRENYAVILVTFLMVPGLIFFPEWFFQALERMKFITILNVLEKSIFTILVFAIVREKEDYILQPLFVSLGYMCSGAIAFYIIVHKWKVKIIRPQLNHILESIKQSTDVFLNTLAPNLFNSFSVILLGFLGGPTANGKLEAGTKFTQICIKFVDIISRTFFPFLSRRINGHHLYATITIAVSVCMTIFLFFASPFLIDLFYTKEFSDAVIVLQISSISLLFVTLGQIYGINYMVICGHERELRNITIIFSVVGFFMAFPLIYYFSFIGAAFAVTIPRGLISFAIVYSAMKIKKKTLANSQ